MMDILKIIISLSPSFLFLAALVFLDSYKLVKLKTLLQTIGAGCIVAGLCLLINQQLIPLFPGDVSYYTRYVAPVIEEIMKAGIILLLMKRKKIGFLVDGAIYGFAVGAGFAAIENIYYLYSLQNTSLFIWLIRGLGTAIMHGGTTAIVAIMAQGFSEKYETSKFRFILPGLAIAVVVHSAFNHFFLSPVANTLVQIVTLPVITFFVYSWSEKFLRNWLELGLDVDVTMLECIMEGGVAETKMGQYLMELKEHFPGEVVADMLCLIRLQLELSIRAKGMLLMRGAGFSVQLDPAIRAQLTELKYLEKNIGKTGKRAMAPIFHTSTRDLWQIYNMA